MKRLFVIPALVLLTAIGWCAPADTPPLAAGARAPGFALLGSDGRAHGLASHQGRQTVVLAFYPKAFTGG